MMSSPRGVGSLLPTEVFKMPEARPLKRKSAKPKVLDEDTYIEEMAKIIQRDFFPDLEKLKAQNDFLDATERKDHQKLRELYIKYSGDQRPPTERYASPATFETPRSDIPGTPRHLLLDKPLRTCESKTNQNKTNDNGSSSKYSLDSYLATHTSEDNSSFQELMEEMGRRSRAKFADQLQQEHDSQLKRLEMCIVPSIEEQANQIEKPIDLDTWSYKAKNYIMYVPDGQNSTDPVLQKQEVVHSNTRMDIDPFDYQHNKEIISQIAKSQEKILSGRIGVDGSTLLDSKSKDGGLNKGSTESSDLTSTLLPHSFVRTPSPCPGAPGESPLMTWGQIEGTPFRLDGGDTPLPGKGSGTSFKMANTSKREQLALALAEKAGQRHRDLKQKAINAAKRSMLSPSPRISTGSTIDRLSSMSPAAQRLATTHLKCHLSRTVSPSPKLTPKSTPGRRTPFSNTCK
ncbi:ess-2 splicing factor homolog isoform X2 [Arctopsyche grandis]|uniref:ess-2 splicing factor homolog isoform X2 n=1 Tax=Arctopsyche grandis TaxID=121162 RepID=UPI00406D8FEF